MRNKGSFSTIDHLLRKRYRFSLLFFFVGLGILSPATGRAQLPEVLLEQARQQRFWEEEAWRKLLHYKKRWFGGYRSQADGEAFFLSPKGKKDPKAELEATLAAFWDPVVPEGRQQHPLCQFPARRIWLAERLTWEEHRLPRVTCTEFGEFRDKLAAEGVSIIFPAYFMNSPSSAFGHTLLRIRRKGDRPGGNRQEFLDYAINYAATITSNNALAYAFMGLTGMFRGEFASMPFYYKIHQYNNHESRDLWTYDLNLTPQEIEMLVAHLWELGSTFFDYFYLSENCSYHVLTALEAAVPRYDLTVDHPLYVIPADTIKILVEQEGLVGERHYRPAIEARMDSRFSLLDEAERPLFYQLAFKKQSPQILALLEEERQAVVLDAAIEYYDFKFFEKIDRRTTEEARVKQELLLARSQLAAPDTAPEITPPQREAPHLGHGSSRVGLAFGSSTQTGIFTRISHRFALHDLLDPTPGYPDYAAIEFMSADLRVNLRRPQVWLEDLSAFYVESYSPWSRLHKRMSWKFRLGATTVRDRNCNNCLAGIAEGGAGLSRQLIKRLPTTLTGTVDAEVSGSPDFQGWDGRFRFGGMLLLKSELHPKLHLVFRGQYRRQVATNRDQHVAIEGGLRWGLGQRFALDLAGRRSLMPGFWEGAAGLYLYY